MFAGRLSLGACSADHAEVPLRRHDHEVTAPPPVQDADMPIAPPAAGSAPLVGGRVIAHPVGALGGGSVPGPCQTTVVAPLPLYG